MMVSWEEYNTKIKIILDETKFKDSYTMELIDTWMRITLTKKPIHQSQTLKEE